MSQPPTARASAWRFAFSLGGLRGKEVGRAAITCSIFTLDPPRANAHSHRTPSDVASEEYKVHLCMQQQNASAKKFLYAAQWNSPDRPYLHSRRLEGAFWSAAVLLTLSLEGPPLLLAILSY